MTPYLQLLRFTKPIGTWLLMFPCWWGLALASPGLPDLTALILFAIGAFLMRGAGCVYNDIVDKDIDLQVERTASRPIAAGTLTRTQATLFLIGLLLCALIVLLQFSPFVILLGASSLLLVFTYPWMKRITYWPQLFLGFTFNWGALMGWAVVNESLSLPAFLLYAAGICWTLGYDTIYAHQDIEDDLRVGVKSSAIALQKNTKPFLWIIYGIMLILLMISGYLLTLSWPFYVGLATAGVMLCWQVMTLDVSDGKNCWKRFTSNAEVGLVIFASIVMGVISP